MYNRPWLFAPLISTFFSVMMPPLETVYRALSEKAASSISVTPRLYRIVPVEPVKEPPLIVTSVLLKTCRPNSPQFSKAAFSSLARPPLCM